MEEGIKSNITIKSNVVLKSRPLVLPIDNMPTQYFDVRMNTILTPEQQMQKEKMMFWAKKVCDESGNPIEDYCYKGCENCGEINNQCKRPQNKFKSH